MNEHTAVTVHPSLPLVEQILSDWKTRIGDDFNGYRNHVYRMLHCCFAMTPCSDDDHQKLMIAACCRFSQNAGNDSGQVVLKESADATSISGIVQSATPG